MMCRFKKNGGFPGVCRKLSHKGGGEGNRAGTGWKRMPPRKEEGKGDPGGKV